MHPYLIEMLECPACHNGLQWRITECRGSRIETAEAQCQGCDAVYPVREGIGIFLTANLPRDDLWEEVDSRLAQYLAAHPEVEHQLLDVPLEMLAPADQFFRALILDERGDYGAAQAAAEMARRGIYTQEYLTCSDTQINYTLEYLSTVDGPIVDIASGMCHFVEKMARKLPQPIVATDFSPRILRRDRRRLEFLGLYDNVSLLAFDARCTPFKNGAVRTLTTYQGLANIREPGELLQELRHVVSGIFLVLTLFFPEDDEANKAFIDELGLSSLLFRRPALVRFNEAGWEVKVLHSCFGKAQPTPVSTILEGAGIDALPVAETTLEWCTVLAKPTSLR